MIQQYIKGPDGKTDKPLIYAYFHSERGEMVRIPVLVDSGTDKTVLSFELARTLGLDINIEPTIGIGASGNPVDLWNSEAKISIKEEKDTYTLRIPVWIMKGRQKMPILLGRDGFFDHFNIEFRHKEKNIVLEKIAS